MFTDIGFDTISIIHPFASAAADSHIGSLNDYSFQSRLGGGLYTLLIFYLNPAQILTYIVPSALLPYTYILSMYISTMLAGIYGYRIGNDYTGAYNYYEGTILWCSLLSIMMLIFCLFFRGAPKKRIIFLLCTLALLFPIVTKLFTFDATKQRWTFVYIIVLICLCIYTLDDITEHTDHIPLKRWLLISDVIILLLLALVFGFSVTGQIAISKRAFVKVIFILFLYNMVFIAMVKKSRQFAALSLLLVVCLDIALETYPIANTRTAIIKENYETSLYNDGTKEAAADIQSKDLGLYRITMRFPMTVTISWVLNRKHML